MKKVKITQIKSTIGKSKRTKATMIALGLTKINQTVEHQSNNSIIGMLRKVNHLINVE